MTDRICSVPDCSKSIVTMDFCSTHYASHRWLGRECSVEGCDRHPRAAGMCTRHYQNSRGTCTVGDCGRPLRAKGMCSMHYRQHQTRICVACGVDFVGDARRQYCTDDCRRTYERSLPVEYAAAHRRVKVLRGSASMHMCVDCGSQADDWSYSNADPEALTNTEGRRNAGLPYSLDPDHYSPRCKACHKIFDLAASDTPARGERQGRSKLTEVQVREIRRRYTSGDIGFQRLANEYGVSKKLVLNIVHRRAWAWLT